MIGLLGSLIGGRGGRMLGGMIGGRTGAMIGGLAGSLLGGRQLGRLGRSVFNRDDDPRPGGGGSRSFEDAPPPPPGEEPLSDESAEILVRVMCNSAKADGHVDQDEADKILDGIGDDVTAGERAFLEAELAAPLRPAAELAQQVPDDLRAEAYAVSVLTVEVDTIDEADYLRDFSAALGLSDSDRAEIHTELGIDSI